MKRYAVILGFGEVPSSIQFFDSIRACVRVVKNMDNWCVLVKFRGGYRELANKESALLWKLDAEQSERESSK